jgi:hypothetical protein
MAVAMGIAEVESDAFTVGSIITAQTTTTLDFALHNPSVSPELKMCT